jgi:hypothetical protein
MRRVGLFVVAILFGTASVSFAQNTPAAQGDDSTKKVDFRILGGIGSGGGGSWLLGAGVGFRPLKNNQKVEIAGDIFYWRRFGSSPSDGPEDGLYSDQAIVAADESIGSDRLGWYGSVNAIYNLGDRNPSGNTGFSPSFRSSLQGMAGRRISPYVGGGIAFVKGGGTAVGAQVLGGIGFPVASLAVRAEARVVFTGGAAFLFVAGIQF